MTDFETGLIAVLADIAKGLESVSTSIDNAPTIDTEITEAGSSIERGLADVAKSIDSLEVNL